jgi:hypothetical protein
VQLSSGLLIPPNTTLLGLGADSTQLEFTMVPPKPTEVNPKSIYTCLHQAAMS